ncbi:hypothetical protein ABLG96_06230 [Nakamurella sp. A5-74]|uniref:Type IV toxin-antitoxin system AbiEi family antitoxin domain-containing protein n=1 Tax=Nakamurella sp. A5-74 TaxID=3158264 RepID=A0AAU8DUM2_9ACTN
MSKTLPQASARAALLAAGVTDAEIRADLHAGRRIRMARGVYLDADRLVDLDQNAREVVRVRAAALQSPGLVLSHRSAAAAHGLPLLATAAHAVHFTRPGSGGSRTTTAKKVHVSRLPDHDRMTIGGLQLTTVARTLFDMGRTDSLQATVVAADAALQRGLIDGPSMRRVLAEHPSTAGRPSAIRALRLADGRSESPGETLTRLALAHPEIPHLELQPEIHDERGTFVGRTDGAIPECGVLLEFDGRSKYTSLLRPGQSVSDVVLAEKGREERLSERGWLVIRVIWADLARPQAFADRVLRACGNRRRPVAAFGLRGSIRTTPPVRF